MNDCSCSRCCLWSLSWSLAVSSLLRVGDGGAGWFLVVCFLQYSDLQKTALLLSSFASSSILGKFAMHVCVSCVLVCIFRLQLRDLVGFVRVGVVSVLAGFVCVQFCCHTM